MFTILVACRSDSASGNARVYPHAHAWRLSRSGAANIRKRVVACRSEFVSKPALLSIVKELKLVSEALPLAELFTLPPREATYVTPSAWGPVVDWQQSNAHRPVSALVLELPLLVGPVLRQKST